MARTLVLLALVACLLTGGVCCWSGMQRPNVLLITVDSLRPDFLSGYGGTHEQTPHIDALATAGVTFTQAVATAPWTRPSMASVLTGHYPLTHGVRSRFDRLADERVTLAEMLHAAGYRTGAVVSSFEVDHIFGLDQGFDTYDDRFDAPIVVVSKRPLHIASVFHGDVEQDQVVRRRKLQNTGMRADERTTDAALGWLRRIGGRRFFLWVHYFGGRERWGKGADNERVTREYQPAISKADEEVGRLLRALVEQGLSRDTVIVLHGDHGRSLLEHGRFGYGQQVYESSVHVPLIISGPRQLPPGRRVDRLVRLVDILPTVVELAGLSVPPRLDGHSLVGVMRDGAAPRTDEAYCETFLPATPRASRTMAGRDGVVRRFGFARRALRGERWKYIRNEPIPVIDTRAPAALPDDIRRAAASEELYDLRHDPDERANLIDAQPAVAAQLRAHLEQYAGRPQ